MLVSEGWAGQVIARWGVGASIQTGGFVMELEVDSECPAPPDAFLGSVPPPAGQPGVTRKGQRAVLGEARR